DEPIACDIVAHYCNHLSFLKVVAVCGNAFEARDVLSRNHIDIIFLDIHIPVLDGLSFLKTLKQPPEIIFTTAYKEYAVDAFELTACDYLLKPFSLERFILALDKAVDKLNTVSNIPHDETSSEHFFIKAEGKIYKISYDEMLYAEAKGNYTKVVTINKTILPAISFSSFEKLLISSVFARVHRSFIINTSKVESIEGNSILIYKVIIPIGSSYKERFLKCLGL
ncbi:MAG: LytR/AlgR family response regulator transcription factor, partial [Mucilaginibacter sp.]